MLNFRTAIIDEHGHQTTDLKLIACMYLRGWFVVDLASVVPVQYIMLAIEQAKEADKMPDKRTEDESAGGSLRLAKILRCGPTATSI